MITANVANLLTVARSQLGVYESPPNSNMQKYGQWYGMNGVAWCAIWVSWVFWHSNNPLPKITTNKGFAYVPEVVRYGQETGTFHRGTSGVEPGDVLVFWFPGGPNRPNHVSICGERGRLPDGRVHSYEGNSNAGGSRTGGSVVELYRRSGIYGYVSIKDAGTTATTPTPEDTVASSYFRDPVSGGIFAISETHYDHLTGSQWADRVKEGAQAIPLNGAVIFHLCKSRINAKG